MNAPEAPRPATSSRSQARLIVAVLLVSLVLRVALSLQGGQYFFGDEQRYGRGVDLYLALHAGQFERARGIAMLPEHMLFTWIGGGVTALQHLGAQLTRFGDWTQPANVSFTIGIGSAVLSLFSTLTLLLTYRLARCLGANEPEALWALLLMAASNTAFYYARHLLPYDCALVFTLAALVIGLGGATPRRALLGGFLSGLGYGVYNGYWYLVPVTWTFYVLAQRSHLRWRTLVFAWSGGAAAGLALPVAYGTAVGGRYYWAILTEFSGSVKQGAMAEGWSLPWEYFWHSEGLVGVAVVVIIAAAVALTRQRGSPLEPRVKLLLIALALAYGLLVLCSVGLRVFVVYARTLKPLVPLACLVGGWALAQLLARRPRWQPVAGALVVAAAFANFWPHYLRVFPRDVEISVLRHWGNPKHTLTVTGSLYTPLALPVARPDLALVNAQLLYPVHHPLNAPAGKTLLRFEHPLLYRPFQYESHHPRERALLRSHDIAIRLIALAAPASVPDDLPVALRDQMPPPRAANP